MEDGPLSRQRRTARPGRAERGWAHAELAKRAKKGRVESAADLGLAREVEYDGSTRKQEKGTGGELL
jgi:hypothetical protein